MKTKSIVTYIVKEFLANIFRLFGGLYLIKFAFRKAPFYLILTYHNFSKYTNYSIKRGSIVETGYAVNFERQVRFLKKHFTFLYPEEFFEAEPEKGLSVLINFDDGYKDNYEIAFPILNKYQAKTVFFVVTSIVGTSKWLQHDKLRLLASNNHLLENEVESHLRKMNLGIELPKNIIDKSNEYFNSSSYQPSMMKWSHLKEIQANGFKIMSQTENHNILRFLKKEEQVQEIMGSVKRIDSELHQKSIYFAYPNGLYDSTTIEILKSNGIKYGFTTIRGFNTKNENKLEIKRICVNVSDSLSVLLLKIFSSALKYKISNLLKCAKALIIPRFNRLFLRNAGVIK